MRGFKFRAWNTVLNCWTSRVELDGGWGKPMFMHGEIENDGGYQTDNTIIEQYTGLKDKNGKEIYEGDIVKFNETICIVEFDEMYARYILRDQSDDVLMGFDALIIIPFEVIGNIHENPELLEDDENENGN